MSGASTSTVRVAVVTGASSGIGEATARLLSERGWRCVLLARREAPLQALADEVDGEVAVCDVSDRRAVEATAAELAKRHAAVHLLVNNAGFLAQGRFPGVDDELVERAMRVNYLGGVWVTRALLPQLREGAASGRAHIVNVVSAAGGITLPAAGPYTASKHAQLAFSRSLRASLQGSGIDVHSILPGFVITEGFPHPKLFQTRVGRRFVVGPEAVAGAIVRAIETGRAELVVPWFPYRLGIAAQGLFPSLTARVLGRAEY